MSRMRFAAPAAALEKADQVVIVAPKKLWDGGWVKALDRPWLDALAAAARAVDAGREGRMVAALGGEKGPRQVFAAVLPDTVSRHNAPSRAEAAFNLIARAELGRGERAVLIVAEEPDHLLPLVLAGVRRFPLYDRRSGAKKQGGVTFAAVSADGARLKIDEVVRETAEAARWAARIVDAPPEELDPSAFVREARALVRGLDSVRTQVVKSAELRDRGLRAIHAVGRAAKIGPRMLVLTHTPPKAKRTFALVGKGVVYDTGGLSLKGKEAMPGMKADLGGAAAVVGAFRTLAAGGFPETLIGVLPLVENAIGPDALRNDDIVEMHSGRTVEINNTDAEGRLILGDAVSWVARERRPEVVIDAATLTGAQLVATGVCHAAVVSNREDLERIAVAAGRASGDLAHPLPFAPELYQKEFASKVADMKNSVANRSNAQSSCAAQFIWAQIDDLDLGWLHVDLAGPAFRDGRGTGFGVALLAATLRALTN